jgi:hypothetical protein
MRKYVVGIVVLVVVAAYGTTSIAQPTPRATTSASPVTVERAGGDPGMERIVRAVVRRSHAAWYVGLTSAGTRIDFRLSRSGLWVRDFHFGTPPLPCAGSDSQTTVGDGNFPLTGLRVTHGTFAGKLHPQAYTPSAPEGYQLEAFVSGRFIDQRHVTGILTGGETRSCAVSAKLTFTATRVRLLPGRPAQGGRYAGQTAWKETDVRFLVSRSRSRVTAFRMTRVESWCMQNKTHSLRQTWFTLTHSYPVAGIGQNRDGEFVGILSSRRTPSGRPAGIRVLVSVLFLGSREATGTARLLLRTYRCETLPWRAALIP